MKSFWLYTALVSCVKLLLFPAYHSTDFEVHRNWLAITYNLNVSQWYFDETSQWTLDYPPLFAWFEYGLSQIAQFFDKEMLILTNLNYASSKTILFQRLSVMLTDFVYYYGVYMCSQFFGRGKRGDIILPIILLFNPGLLMVDHIHFQYNGLMYGILLISICKIMQKQYIKGAFFFAFLLNMKHIYIYIGPAYFVFLLKEYCLNKHKKLKLQKTFVNLSKLGAVVVAVFAITFLPFYDHITQVMSRLFPFRRGLCHAYWAPNFWAIYNVIDKIAVIIVSKMGFKVSLENASMTAGLVREYSHSVLPNITPKITLVLVIAAMLPSLWKLWVSKSNNFLRCIVICAFSSFLFGWHVHEKAILMAIIPLSILSVVETGDAQVFLLLATVGHYSIFPLLFPSNLLFVKALLVLIHSVYAFWSLFNLYPFQFCKLSLPLLNPFESLYVLGLAPLFVYTEVLHQFILPAFQFLPLMITSVYCSFGIIYCFAKYYIYFLMKCQ